MKPKHYYCEMYKMNFYFFIGWTEQEFINYTSKHLNYSDDLNKTNGVTLLCENEIGVFNVVWTKYKTKYSILAHECIHAAKNTLEMRGIDISSSDGEPLAYYVELLMNKALDS